jgi:hypothetical protein
MHNFHVAQAIDNLVLSLLKPRELFVLRALSLIIAFGVCSNHIITQTKTFNLIGVPVKEIK